MATYDREMTLLEHLDELRVRLTRAVLGLLVATMVGLIFVDRLLVLLLHPLGGLRLTTLTVLEPFLVKMKISFLFGIVLSMPWVVYQLFAFINPALTEHERRKTVPIALLAGALFACGVVFAYVFVMPISTHWLLAQAGGQFNVLITANSYITYVLFFLGIVGATFETPLLILGARDARARQPPDAPQGVADRLPDRRGDRRAGDPGLEPCHDEPGLHPDGAALPFQHPPVPDLRPAAPARTRHLSRRLAGRRASWAGTRAPRGVRVPGASGAHNPPAPQAIQEQL